MTFDELMELVAKLRTAQKNYFSTRQPRYLPESKQWEHDVDKIIAEFFDKQENLKLKMTCKRCNSELTYMGDMINAPGIDHEEWRASFADGEIFYIDDGKLYACMKCDRRKIIDERRTDGETENKD